MDRNYLEDIIKDSVNYLRRTNMVYEKYLKRRALAKENLYTYKEELEKAKRIFDDELRAC